MSFFSLLSTPPHHHRDFSDEVSNFVLHYQEIFAILFATSLLSLVKAHKYRRSEEFFVLSSQFCLLVSGLFAVGGVLLSKSTETMILRYEFDPLAENTYALLMRESLNSSSLLYAGYF